MEHLIVFFTVNFALKIAAWSASLLVCYLTDQNQRSIKRIINGAIPSLLCILILGDPLLSLFKLNSNPEIVSAIYFLIGLFSIDLMSIVKHFFSKRKKETPSFLKRIIDKL